MISFRDVISLENLLRAWRTFCRGKRGNIEVARFELRLEENLFDMHASLASGMWKPDPYVRFLISDPKPRVIHKASVRDRVLFQAVYQSLYHIFDTSFVHDSYASRNFKGTHAGVRRCKVFARKVTGNHSRSGWVLKCDIRKFFDSIDHGILLSLISEKIEDKKLLALICHIVHSFEAASGRGLPLGNVTSQLFANIYLNELDQFIKHSLKAQHYIRYCDDFVVLHESKQVLEECITRISDFLQQELELELHPNKVHIRKIIQGTDFLGYVSLPHYCVLRTRTKRRMLRRLSALAESIRTEDDFKAALPVIHSYLGMLSHCKGWSIEERIIKLFARWM